MTSVRKFTTCVTALLILGLPSGVASTADDPQSLFDEAREAFNGSDIEKAESTIESLRDLLDADPGWDPDGSFAKVLLPKLEARMSRTRAAIAELNTLPERAREERSAPQPSEDPQDLAPYLGWATGRVDRTRDHMNRIAETLPAGAERCAVVQSESYARAAKLVETEILPDVTNSLQVRVDDLLDGDERTRALKTRLDSLKREVVTSSVEREGLQVELETARAMHDAYQRALIEFIGQDPEVAEASASPDSDELAFALALRVRDRHAEVRMLEQQTLLEKTLRLEELERLRLANAASIAEGSRDITGRIEALQAAVERVPLAEDAMLDPSMGWFSCCMSVCRR